LSLFSRIFKAIPQEEPKEVIFGRFSDAFKPESRYDSWDKAMEHFENGSYISSYQHFLDYLKNESGNNLSYEIKGQKMQFEMYQGSKKIMGTCDGKTLKAEAKLARAKKMNMAVMRRLLEQNFSLQYTRYALLDEDMICMVFHTSVIDASPYKLYYGLKELALHVDKQDDLLVGEFEELEATETSHIKFIDPEEARVKYDFYKKEIQKTLDWVENYPLDFHQFPGAESFLYLDLIYKLDYLLKPEGKIMQWIESAHNEYFSQKATLVEKRNQRINMILREMLTIDFEAFRSELYTVISTFGITAPSSQHKIADTIENELGHMDWYYEKGHTLISEAIPSYIAGYNLFSSSMPAPCRSLIHLMYNVLNHDFFAQLGFPNYLDKKGRISPMKVKAKLKDIVDKHKLDFPRLKLDASGLSFEDKSQFAKSILLKVGKMDCNELKRT
jgi:hypothetical protein